MTDPVSRTRREASLVGGDERSLGGKRTLRLGPSQPFPARVTAGRDTP